MDRQHALLEDMTEIALDMHDAGWSAPSFKEIHAKLTNQPGWDDIGRGEVLGNMRKLRSHLEEAYDFKTVLVCDAYYERGFETDPPATEAEAEKALAGVPHGQGTGIYFVRRHDDPIYIAMLNRNGRAGGGKVRTNVERTVKAIADGDMSTEQAVGILERFGQNIVVKDEDLPELPKHIQRQLRLRKGEDED